MTTRASHTYRPPGRKFTAGNVGWSFLLLATMILGIGIRPIALKAAEGQTTADSERKAKFDRLDAEMQDAIDKVKAIVNQPVTAVRRTPQMQVSVFSPGWFHEGALKPDFNHVDVRQTQDTSSYSRFPFVTSDLNPGIAFIGSQLEFNSMTKYFYINRSLPKKRLTEAEMLEINRLYRIIGKCEQEEQALAQTEETEPAPEKETTEKWVLKPIPRKRYIMAGIGIVVVLGLYILIRKSR